MPTKSKTKTPRQIFAENVVPSPLQSQLKNSRQIVERLLQSNHDITLRNAALEGMMHSILAAKDLDQARAIAKQALHLDRIGNSKAA